MPSLSSVLNCRNLHTASPIVERAEQWFFPITSRSVDAVLTAIAAGSFFLPASYAGNFLIQGTRAFALVNLADRALRNILLRKFETVKEPFFKGARDALIEEGLYSGILSTRSAGWAIPRFAVSLIAGATAARSQIEEIEAPHFTLDNRVGFLWAVFRELSLWCLPARISIPFLIAEDSAIYGLGAVCPTKNSALAVSSPVWMYKNLSARIFRVVAALITLHAGCGAAAVQHLLFNFSRSLPENSSQRT